MVMKHVKRPGITPSQKMVLIDVFERVGIVAKAVEYDNAGQPMSESELVNHSAISAGESEGDEYARYVTHDFVKLAGEVLSADDRTQPTDLVSGTVVGAVAAQGFTLLNFERPDDDRMRADV